MKILIVNTSDIMGGAAIAAYRLHKALLDQGVDSTMLVQSKASDDYTVIGPDSKAKKVIARVRPTLDALPLKRYPQRNKTLFSPAWLPFSGIAKKINLLNPDIVHMHWICGGLLRLEDLARIKAHVVWSLHDMWAFTGGCHNDGECGKYTEQCGQCPVFCSSSKRDLSKKIFFRKQRTYAKINSLTINCPSRWLAGCAKSSTLFAHRKVVNLPNPIDTETYKPLSKNQSKKILGLSLRKKYVLFGAINPTIDPNKGFNVFTSSMHHLEKKDIELIVFGVGKPKNVKQFPIPARYFGRLKDEISLRIIYCAADVMVVPSFQENLSNTIMEALSCGTPVVAFRVGGNADMIDHKSNGYLAEPFSNGDLAQGISWILSHPEPLLLRQMAREKVLKNFESNLVSGRYIKLYSHLISK